MADEDQKDQTTAAEEAATEDKAEPAPAEQTEDPKAADAKPEAEAKPEPAAKQAADAKPEAKADAKTDTKPESTDDQPAKAYSKDITKMIEQIEKMTVLEVADLVSAIEDKFGVSAAPVAVAGAAPAAGGGEEAGGEEKSSYTVHLAAAGDQKINVIKAIREVTDLGLQEAKALVDEAPKDVKTDVPKEDAEAAKQKLEAAGATVELK